MRVQPGRRLVSRCFAAAALSAAACAGPSPRTQGAPEGARPEAPRAGDGAAPAAPAAPREAPPPSTVATVDGAPVDSTAAFRLLLLSVPDEANNAVRQLVLDRLAAGEAARQGLTVPPAVVEREFARLIADQERRVAEASKGARDLAGHVKATWGIGIEAYRQIAQASLERSLLLERVVLHELLLHPRLQIRVIRVKEKKLADEIAKKLDQGADFAALARQHSEDGSARDGGVYPPLPSDLPSPLFEHTDALAAGGRSPVHEVATADGPRYRIVQLLARLPVDERPAEERAAAVEALLDGRALAPPELEAWMRLMETRHEIRFQGLGIEPR